MGSHTAKVVEQCQVSPPSGTVPQASISLTFFDLRMLILYRVPARRVFFYQLHQPITKTQYLVLVDELKSSLSITLQHFYPLAGKLRWLKDSKKPDIVYCDGDSISFTVVESDYDFNHLSSDYSRDCSEFYHLVPQLTPMIIESNNNVLIPLFACQVTLFPDYSGICIGISCNHVVADGLAISHFVKSWASVCSTKSGVMPNSLPFCDRTVVKDKLGLESMYLNDLQKYGVSQESFQKPRTIDHDHQATSSKVRATYMMGESEIERLKQWFLNRVGTKSKQYHLSKFVMTCAYIWVCWVRAARRRDHVWARFCFPAECRNRLDPPLPATYFGNCVSTWVVEAKWDELIGEDNQGLLIAIEKLSEAVHKINNRVLMIKLTDFLTTQDPSDTNPTLGVAWSPKMKIYETDFGWGKPKKAELVSNEEWRTMSLSERYDGEEGLEFGLVLDKLEMDTFASYFADTIKLLGLTPSL